MKGNNSKYVGQGGIFVCTKQFVDNGFGKLKTNFQGYVESIMEIRRALDSSVVRFS